MTEMQGTHGWRPAHTWTALAAIVLLAAGLRLYRLDSLPAGLHFDEAANGMLGLDILAGKLPIFFSAYNGREALYHYLVALCIELSGRNVLAVRLPAALAGVALVIVVFLVGRRSIGTGGALLAAGATAGASWLLHLNRIGFRANLLPLTLSLWVWLLLRGLAARRWCDWFAAGMLLGLTAYTYLAARFVPILVLALLLYLAIWQRPLLRRSWRGGLLMLAVAALIALPLGLHFVRTPSDWGERTGQVWVCADLEPAACFMQIGVNAWRTLGMVGVRGDPQLFYNLPHTPVLPVAVGWLFYVGLLLALRRWREPEMALLVLWWIIMVVPGILSVNSPSYVRTMGAAAPTMIIWALPLTWAARRMQAGHVPGLWNTQARLAPILAAILLMLINVWGTWNYFGRWVSHPQLYYDYMQFAVDAAHAAQETPPEVTLYISEEYYRHPTYLYLAPRTVSARWFDARTGWPLAPTDQRARYFIPATTPVDHRVHALAVGFQGENVVNERGQYAYTIIELPMTTPVSVTPATRTENQLGGLRLTGFTVAPGQLGTELEVTFSWQVQAPSDRYLHVFLHLVDQHNQRVAQHDALGYPSLEWRAGDRFLTFHTIPLPTDLPPGEYRLITGLYDLFTGERLTTTGPGAREHDLVLPLSLNIPFTDAATQEP